MVTFCPRGLLISFFHLYQGETPHSFRNGGTVDSLKRGRSLEDTLYLAYMKNKHTAAIYSRGLQVLLPKGLDSKDAGVGNAQEPINTTELSEQMRVWKPFL